MRLRRVQRGDVGVVLTMMATYYGYDGLDFDHLSAGRRLRELLRKPELGGAWLIEERSKPAGYLFVIRGFGLEHGRNVLIDELFLAEPYRGRGWGARIVAQVRRYAKQVRAESIHAQVERHNRPACAFWSAMGFRRYDRYAMVQMLAGKTAS